MDKIIVKRNFSRFAPLYDKYADVQRKTACELLDFIKRDNPEKILELGCGTGNYTALLRSKFRNSEIKAVDICEKMIAIAKKKLKAKDIKFLIQDAESLVLDEKYDLITSNACFQWFEDLEKTLFKYQLLLSNNGIITFSIFGPETFMELNSSIKSVLKDISITVDGFIDKKEIKKILEGNFRQINIKEIKYKENFRNLEDLLNKIRYTGTRGNGSSKRLFLSNRLLNEIEKAYLDKFKRIRATYQVFFVQAEAR